MPRIIEAGGGKRLESRGSEDSESKRRSLDEAGEVADPETEVEAPSAEVETPDIAVVASTSGEEEVTPDAPAEAVDAAVEAAPAADADADADAEAETEGDS